MNALLDAMKKINGGAPAEVVATMQRLEDSYDAVKKVIETGVVAPEVAAPAASPSDATTPEPTEETLVGSVASISDVPSPLSTAEEQSVVAEDTPAAVTPLQSVAAQKQATEANREALTADARAEQATKEAAIAAMDPLQVPDVTNGLNQLLSEWNLFKSSGIFGTGPRGIEHPLYIELAPLMMSAIIAGRFESATPDVKQSIADYICLLYTSPSPRDA